MAARVVTTGATYAPGVVKVIETHWELLPLHTALTNAM